MAPYLRRFDSSEVAKQRLKIVKFYEAHGEKACKEAFCVNRKLIYVWRRRMRARARARGNHISALISTSTRPVNTRASLTNSKVLEYIKHLREHIQDLVNQRLNRYWMNTVCYKTFLSTQKVRSEGLLKNTTYFIKEREGFTTIPILTTNKQKRLKD